MKIFINGKKSEYSNSLSLTAIIEQHNINPNNCIIELNGELIKKENFNLTQVKEGDHLELLRFIGGG